jgi:hypothetical protein
VQGVLNRRPTDARERRNFIDGKVANATTLDLPSDDAQNRPLALGIVMSEIDRQCAGSTEHPAPVSRCFTVGRSLPLTWGEAAAQSRGKSAGRLGVQGRVARRAAAFDEGLKIVTLAVADLASTVGLPKHPRRIVQLIRIAAKVDGLIYRACDRAEGLLR